jgi:hypothetical protein
MICLVPWLRASSRRARTSACCMFVPAVLDGAIRTFGETTAVDSQHLQPRCNDDRHIA